MKRSRDVRKTLLRAFDPDGDYSRTVRRSGLEFSTALAVASVIAAVSVAWSLGLSLHDPDGSTGPTYIRLPAIVALALLADIVPRSVIKASGWRDLRRATASVWRERWTPANLRFMLLGLAGWYATYAAIRNLKGFVPFANGNLYDSNLARLDRAMFFGHRPAEVMHDVLGTDFAAHILSFSYILWIVLLPASLAFALVWARHDRISSWWVTAVSVDWVLGVAINYALPTVGPIYERPGDFADLTTTGTTSLQQNMWTERVDVLSNPAGADTVQNIAAFASLHVAIAMTALMVAQRAGLHRALVWSLRVFLVVTMLATVYFGWHYVSDVIAGLLLGIVGAWVGEYFAAPEEDQAIPPSRIEPVDVDSELDATDLAGSRSRE
jgi:hypothetical protein